MLLGPQGIWVSDGAPSEAAGLGRDAGGRRGFSNIPTADRTATAAAARTSGCIDVLAITAGESICSRFFGAPSSTTSKR